MPVAFTIASDLASPAATVWTHAAGFAGVNAELWPIAMSAPAELMEPLALERFCPTLPARRLLVSWISLLGIVPLDRHVLGLDRMERGRGFWEVSHSLTMAEWRHTRTIDPTPSGCRVVDQLVFRSRLPGLDQLLAPLYRLIFRRRHRVLRRLFG